MNYFKFLTTITYIDPGTAGMIVGGSIWPWIVAIITGVATFFAKKIISPIKKISKRKITKKGKILLLCLVIIILLSTCFFQEKKIDLSSGVLSLPYITDNNLDLNIGDNIETNIYFSEKLQEGYNVYRGYIFDLNGKLVYTFPENTSFHTFYNNSHYFAKIIPNNYETGFLSENFTYFDMKIGFFENHSLLWSLNLPVHHHIELTKNKTILFLSKELKSFQGYDNIGFDLIYEINIEGKILNNWSSFNNLNNIKSLLEEKKIEELIFNKNKNVSDFDYFHINYIQEIPKNNLSYLPEFKEGNWLISIRNFNLIIIIDKNTKEILWSYGPGIIEQQHGAQLLESGNILIFDNGPQRGFSRVIKINPISKEIVWEYPKGPDETLYSRIEGFAQELDNGNILITESNKQKIFEINSNQTIIAEWFFNNSHRIVKSRNSIYRVLREPKQKYEYYIK
jgi:hypothetical protein